jgi:hypothetical protein
MEQRKDMRRAVFAPVEIIAGRSAYCELITDISPGGAFIESEYKLPIGQRIKLAFIFPSYHHTISLAGHVVRRNARGYGIRFINRPHGRTAAAPAERAAVSPG